ncbi:hypothetical protein QQP08_003816 [Theobroma cacao]|nr:hypothetical protein QQP08_003816 [Theobroma cacao]
MATMTAQRKGPLRPKTQEKNQEMEESRCKPENQLPTKPKPSTNQKGKPTCKEHHPCPTHQASTEEKRKDVTPPSEAKNHHSQAELPPSHTKPQHHLVCVPNKAEGPRGLKASPRVNWTRPSRRKFRSELGVFGSFDYQSVTGIIVSLAPSFV